jgi:hypothetical protein
MFSYPNKFSATKLMFISPAKLARESLKSAEKKAVDRKVHERKIEFSFKAIKKE